MTTVGAVFAEMKRQKVINDFAIGGSIALMTYTEPIPTDDLDIFVALPTTGLLVDFEPVATFLRKRGYVFDADGHVRIDDMPVHILPATPGLVEEALKKALPQVFRGYRIKVFAPEYLVAIMYQLRRPKDMARLAILSQYRKVDQRKLAGICKRYHIRCQ